MMYFSNKMCLTEVIVKKKNIFGPVEIFRLFVEHDEKMSKYAIWADRSETNFAKSVTVK